MKAGWVVEFWYGDREYHCLASKDHLPPRSQCGGSGKTIKTAIREALKNARND